MMTLTPKANAQVSRLAKEYHDAVHAAAQAAVDGEDEAQLTTPVSNLFVGVALQAGLGGLRLIRETRLNQTRPDFAAIVTRAGKTQQKGYIELKAPHVSVDVTRWTGRNARQWERMKSEAEIIIICNGTEAQLYHEGNFVGPACSLPYHDWATWNPNGLTDILRRFFDLTPTPVVSVSDLSRRLAIRTADLRDRLLWLLEGEGIASEAAKGGFRSWRQSVYLHASKRDFADGVSQVVAYGMVLAALSEKEADKNGDGLLTVAEARAAIRGISPVLAAAFAPLIDKVALADAVQVELGALETLVSAINVNRVNKSADKRGDPWLYFYEDFLSVYDPEERKQAGVYYTPIDIVKAMVSIADNVLVERFGKRLGFADPSVITLDPATGTGTFPLAVIDKAAVRAKAARGTAGESQAAVNLAKSLFAFELLPGPYSVAHLRLSQRLALLSKGQVEVARVILTDTLESPLDPNDQLALFGDAEVLAAEQNRAKRVKLDQRVTVAIGNPPYRRVERDTAGRGSGGWVVDGKVPGRRSSKSLFDNILDVARDHTIFSHHASLYNLYVYFWRWAIWKAFEAHGSGPGVVAFITASSWLTGPGFIGLRQLVRELCDDIWVIDLGGDNRGAHPEENVFAIETPVAVVVLVRDEASNKRSPANVHYRRISGTSEAKLQAMAAIAASDEPLAGDWTDAPSGWHDPLVPPTGSADWTQMPLITDIFPWQQPGCKIGRTWPIAPVPEMLEKRWQHFVDAPNDERPDLFSTASTGRTINTKVDGYLRLSEVKKGSKSSPVVRYGYRSFDRQWTFADPRLAALERPSLWQSASNKQFFLCSLLTGRIGGGPAITVSAHVPDLHYFRGNFGGKDIIPMYRDAQAKRPNITKGLPEVIANRLGIEVPDVQDIGSYVYALLSASAYQINFAEELKTPGLRVPITAEADLWNDAVEIGKELLWLHTYGERLQIPRLKRGANVPSIGGIGWNIPVTVAPNDMNAVIYNKDKQELSIGDGVISGVRPDVWAYEVSGMGVVRKWLGYRTVRGVGRAASSKNVLDNIRFSAWPDAWNDEILDLIRVLTSTLDKQAKLSNLLDQICKAPQIVGSELPIPRPSEKKVPKTNASMGLELEG